MMKKLDDDLHGNVPDSSNAALLLVDVINDLDFPENEALLSHAEILADNIYRLKSRHLLTTRRNVKGAVSLRSVLRSE